MPETPTDPTPERARFLRLLESDVELREAHEVDPQGFEYDFLEFVEAVNDPGSAEADRRAFQQFRELFS